RWLETERARLREAASRAAVTLVGRSEECGNLTTAVHWARRGVELTPNEEVLVRRLITLLDRHGDRAGALEAYEEFAVRLREEYDAQPAAETQDLIAAVRARERAAGPAPRLSMDVLARLRAGLADRYRVERELAHGRTAAVFLGHDVKHDRPVAIKVLHPELAAAVGANRFLREIQLAARLQHPHIVALHDSGETDGLLYFVMPYVAGESLRARLDREPQVPIPEAVRIMGDVAQAILARHAVDPVAPIRTVRETVPPGVERAVLKALAKVPADRYPGATEFAQALAEPGPAPPVPSRWGRPARRAAITALASLALLVALNVAGSRDVLLGNVQERGNREAYDLYLSAKVHLLTQNREEDSVAITLLEQAVALDPSSAIAEAELARAYALRVDQFAPDDRAALERARLAAERALRLNPD